MSDNIVHVVGNKRIRKRSRNAPNIAKNHPMATSIDDKIPHDTNSSQVFQAPHHQQESMVELTDDATQGTESVPGRSAPSWKPVDGSVPTHKLQMSKAKGFSFKKSIPVKNMWEDIPFHSDEICWELNTFNEKEHVSNYGDPIPQLTNDSKPPNPVIQGTASEIKLVKQEKQISMTSSQMQRGKPILSSHTQPEETDTTSKASLYFIFPGGTAVKADDTTKKPLKGGIHFPAGVPRTFLAQQQTMGAIQPQIDPGAAPSHNVYDSIFDIHGQNSPLYVQTNQPSEAVQQLQYSPSDTYEDGHNVEQGSHEGRKDSSSPDPAESQSGKRVSAFHRLGPLTQPKKPKLTINLLCNKDVREVVDETEAQLKYVPVHLCKHILESKDETVVKYLPHWPWKKNIGVRKAVTARTSKSVMILEQEQMEEAYDRDNMFFQLTVKGYPQTWRKEDVLDVILESVKGKSFIPCFIEFNPLEQCKFLVIRSRAALTAIHKLGFYVRKDDVELGVTISQINLGLKQIDFIPRLVLRKRLAQGYDGERKLNLSSFTTKDDISHFVYFPLNRQTNQRELIQIQSTIAWDFLTDLDLSHNRITSVEGFSLPKTTPKLKNLDLSYNCLEKVTLLLRCRELPLHSLKLEGNPLCHDYIDPDHYVKAIRMMFPELMEIDGLPIRLKGEMPHFKRNYCPEDAQPIVEKFLAVYFPLLDSPVEERLRIEDLYHEKAVMTVTYRFKLRHSPLHRYFRTLFLRARSFDEGDEESIEGASAIVKLISKWPAVEHDKYTFTVDVMHHSETSTILRVSGILKLTAETLAEDEHLLAFTRTVVLTTKTSGEYKIQNEMVYWDPPSKGLQDVAFQINTSTIPKRLSLKFHSAPDDDVKENLTQIFMKLTDLDSKTSERCLDTMCWNLKDALEYFIKLVKLDGVNAFKSEHATQRNFAPTPM